MITAVDRAVKPQHKQKNYYQTLSHNSTHSSVLVGEKGLYFDRLPFNRWLKLFNCQIFSRLSFSIKGCSSKTSFISSIFRLLCISLDLWHYVRDHIIYTVYSDWVLVFAFVFLSCKKEKKSALIRTFSTESYRNWQKSINILKNNGLFLKNKPYGPRQANLVLIAYASSEGSGEPAHSRSLARTSAARSYKQWVKRNLQSESQIPSPSEWLGMRS